MRMARHACLASALLLGGLSVSCRSAPKVPPVATLLEGRGSVAGSFHPAPVWAAVTTGTQFHLDDAVRTGAGSEARLDVAGGAKVRMSENSLLRFTRGAAARPGDLQVSVELGGAEVEPGGAVVIGLPDGRAQIAPGSRVRISADGQRDKLEVVVGRATLILSPGEGGKTGREVSLGEGEGVVLEIGRAVVERYALDPGAKDSRTPLEAEPAAAPVALPVGASGEGAPGHPASPRQSGAVDAVDAKRADVTVELGESLILHDGRGSLLVRMLTGRACPDGGGGTLELDNRAKEANAFSGAAAIVVRLTTGRHVYRLRCASDGPKGPPRAMGSLIVSRDSGNVPLARRAPANDIEADGRRYTVLFQTRPPALTLSWKDPAGAAHAPYELSVSSSRETQTFHSKVSSVRLPSGALGEGDHTWWFSTPDGRQSPKTTVGIVFDNTAPTAQFFRADQPGLTPGNIAIDGATVQGARVSAAGKTLALDPRGRFRDEVAPLPGDDAVSVRVDLPHGEAHCYVRRRAAIP